MIDTEIRQLKDELYLWSNKKEFTGFFYRIKRALKTNIPPKILLLDKRKKYDLGYIDILKKYNINTEGIYDELDQIWKNIKTIDEVVAINPVAMMPIGMRQAHQFNNMKILFQTYLKESLKIVERRVNLNQE